MRKVWCVTYGSYTNSTYSVCCVFTAKELAEEYCKIMNTTTQGPEYRVEEFGLNPPTPKVKPIYYYSDKERRMKYLQKQTHVLASEVDGEVFSVDKYCVYVRSYRADAEKLGRALQWARDNRKVEESQAQELFTRADAEALWRLHVQS